ncbi:hypothetical protein N7495_002653 [Penicillium taxi]|uniref:uncharacterized protein n=1 Tax=Penicillium taxi TaxID=168475 RepID=UPI002545BA71|nr:uncharacterized protein N7495_002653 [Penicillium taxi]KAJ5902125.1 hypothetical protein N7495_002653 [Penicillium taxi]
MVAMLATTEKIVRAISRGQVCGLFILKVCPLRDDELCKNLESGLTASYTTSLDLLTESEVLFSTDTAKHTLEAILNPRKPPGSVSTFSEQEDELLRDVEACETRRKINADDGMIGMLHTLNTSIAGMDEDIQHLLQNANEHECIEMLE